MDIVKKHFEEEASEFDKIITQVIPYYPEMIESLILTIPFHQSSSINVIDLGCGTGTISKCIMNLFPNANLTCLDLAENMIEIAKIKLAGYSRTRFQLGDFRSYEFDDKYDVAVSSLALHHLVTNDDKSTFYRKIYTSLNPGGIFLNADVVLGSSDHIQSIYIDKWKQFMTKFFSESEINNRWLAKYREEDHPAKLLDQLTWLVDLGFVEVDIVWKYFNFSVYSGMKPTKNKKNL